MCILLYYWVNNDNDNDDDDNAYAKFCTAGFENYKLRMVF